MRGHRASVSILAWPVGRLAAAFAAENPERLFNGERMEADAEVDRCLSPYLLYGRT